MLLCVEEIAHNESIANAEEYQVKSDQFHSMAGSSRRVADLSVMKTPAPITVQYRS